MKTSICEDCGHIQENDDAYCYWCFGIRVSRGFREITNLKKSIVYIKCQYCNEIYNDESSNAHHPIYGYVCTKKECREKHKKFLFEIGMLETPL